MSREKFEQLCVERMAEWRGAGNTLDDNGSPLTVEALCWKDENGNYGVLALNAAWWGYRMAAKMLEREMLEYNALLSIVGDAVADGHMNTEDLARFRAVLKKETE